MVKVTCSAVDCIYNSGKHKCKADEINMSDGYYHTVHEGVMHTWKCKKYEKDQKWSELEERFEEIIRDYESKRKAGYV